MRRLVPVWLVVALLWALAGGARALEPAPVTALGDAGPARVVFVTERLRHQHFIEVRVQGLRDWTRRGDGSPWKLVPYIDQRALAGLYPVAVDTASGTLQYMLRSNADNADTWAHLLSPLTFERPVRFSVGLEHEDALPSAFGGADGRVKLIVVDRLWSAMAVVVVLVLGFSLARLALRTDLLLDMVGDADSPDGVRFSLAKVQFALWFFVILNAFLVIWLTTGNFNSLNTSVVAVLGISAGTAVGDNLLRRMGGAQTTASPTAPPAGPSHPLRPWRAFFGDLVCDARGHSISRFQMLAWTAILIVVFLVDVVDDLVMPLMGPELLYLLGLSSGTYVAQSRPGGLSLSPSLSLAPSTSPSPPTTASAEASPSRSGG